MSCAPTNISFLHILGLEAVTETVLKNKFWLFIYKKYFYSSIIVVVYV